MATIKVNCRLCNQTAPVRKHGTATADFQRFRCINYKRPLPLDYAYEA